MAQTVRLALDTGLAGCSIEDSTGRRPAPYRRNRPGRRQGGGGRRRSGAPALSGSCSAPWAENYLHGRPDLGDTISRLQGYQDAGADALFAPGLTDLDDIRRVVSSVDKPVNVLARPGGPDVSELAEAGVARISVGGALCFAARRAVVDVARQLQEHGTFGFFDQAAVGLGAARVKPSPTQQSDSSAPTGSYNAGSYNSSSAIILSVSGLPATSKVVAMDSCQAASSSATFLGRGPMRAIFSTIEVGMAVAASSLWPSR